MPLHRLTVPTYPGGLPGTHDYINNPALNGDIGVPAPADAKKGSGPNEGTYFVAFGENATSTFVNRGMTAMSESTDYLDDVVHRDLAIPAVGAVATPGAPLASVTIPGIDVFVGAIGTPLTQRALSGLIGVVDNEGIPLHVLNGNVYVPILVSAITDGVSNVVGVPADGFYTAPTVEFSLSIPAGQSYRLVYYKRSNVVGQEAGMLSRFNDGVRGIEDLWAQSTNTLSGVTTFTSAKTFAGSVSLLSGFTTAVGSFGIFDGEARFNDPVEFAATAVATFRDQVDLFLGLDTEIPKVLGPAFSASIPTLMYQQTQSGGSVYRVYFGGGGGWTESSVVVTVNARWDEGPDVWVPDNINDAATRVVLGLSGGIGLKNHKVDPLPATWVDADWDAGTDDVEYTYGGGYSAAPQSAVIRRTNKTHKIPFLDAVNTTLSTTFDYEWLARFSLAFSDRSSMWYSPYKEEDEAGSFAGVSLTNNCEWDADDVRFESQVSTRHSSQVGFNGDDGVLLRKKIPVPTTPANWLDDAWDFEGSLRGMQLSNWTMEVGPTASLLAMAVRPRTATRSEMWVIGFSGGGGGEFTRAPTPTGGYSSLATSASSSGSTPRSILWHEDTSLFYALLTDGVIDTSPTAETWSLAGNAGLATLDQFDLDSAGAIVAIDVGSTDDVRTAASVGGVYSTVQVGTGGHVLRDVIWCRRSGLWVTGAGADFGVDSGIYTSPDRTTWSPVAISGTALADGEGEFLLAYNPERNIVVAFGRTDSTGVSIIIRSYDGGTTWARVEPLQDLSEPPFGGAGGAVPTGFKFIGGRFVCVRQSPGVDGTIQVVTGSPDGLRWSVAYDFADNPAAPGGGVTQRSFAGTDTAAAFVSSGNIGVSMRLTP